MSYSTDKPITSKEEDVLGRKDFSQRLGRLIYNYRGEDGLVLGLYGEWGSGKTSVINMVEEEINRLIILDVIHKHAEGKISLTDSDTNSPLFMRFSPWHYSDKDNLISLFFKSLTYKIDCKGKFKDELGKALNAYAEIFDPMALLPPIPGLKIVSKFMRKQIKLSYEKKADLDNRKKALEKALKKVKKKIVIVIDDIDRLTNTQIRDIFQLVKSVGELPYIIYILAMDREIVERALTEVHQTDGSRYLEKIIQMPVEIPKLNEQSIKKILEKEINKVRDKFQNEIDRDKHSSYSSDVFYNCVSPYITTLRDVNRLVNIFQFRYGMLYEGTAFEDMLGITTLELFEPKLYRWIYNNKDSVCGLGKYSLWLSRLLFNNDTKPDYHKLYSAEFIEMGINPKRAIRCIATMFPVFAQNVKYKQKKSYVYPSDAELQGKMRVACSDRFESYFEFKFKNRRFSRSFINSCLLEFNREKLSEEIEKLIKGDNIRWRSSMSYFLEDAIILVNKIPYERLNLIISVILDLQGELFEYVYRFNGDVYKGLGYFLYSIINRFETEKERYDIIRYWMENANKFTLGIMTGIMNRIESVHGKLDSIEDTNTGILARIELELKKLGENSRIRDEKIISLEHLKELEKSYLEQIHIILKSESILVVNSFRLIFYLWQFLDKEGAIEYLQELFEYDEVNKLKFICAILSDVLGRYGIVSWGFTLKSEVSDRVQHFNKSKLKDFVSKDEIDDVIQRFDKSRLEEFWMAKEKTIIALFYLVNYNKDDMENITEKEARKLVSQWEAEQRKKIPFTVEELENKQ